MLFKSSLQVFVDLLSKCYKQQLVGLWLGVKRFLCECVVCVCLAFGTIFLLIAFIMAIGFLMGVLTISFALPIDLYKSLWISKNG